MPRLQAVGRLKFLRVHDRGTKFGPPADQIDVEVIFGIEGREGGLGFQLRDDANRPARQAMLDLLRDAFAHGWTVHTDYDIEENRKNGVAMRVWLTRSTAPVGPVIGSVGPVVAPIVVAPPTPGRG
jgi:hypothetical protein